MYFIVFRNVTYCASRIIKSVAQTESVFLRLYSKYPLIYNPTKTREKNIHRIRDLKKKSLTFSGDKIYFHAISSTGKCLKIPDTEILLKNIILLNNK